MPQVVIDNPILNSAFDEPARHFQCGDEGITNEIVETRRTSSYFIPIAQPKKKGQQLQFETEWTKDRSLLTYWTDPEREKKLFFCQIEAVETAIYVTEVARKYGDAWIENDLKAANDTIVKVPRVPVADNSMTGDQPTCRSTAP